MIAPAIGLGIGGDHDGGWKSDESRRTARAYLFESHVQPEPIQPRTERVWSMACEVCGTEFYASRVTAYSCSARCRQRRRRDRGESA